MYLIGSKYSVQSNIFGSLKEKGDVEIVDATIDEFTEFMKFFYLSDATLLLKNIASGVRLADKYDAMDCVLTPENICWGYEMDIYLKNELLINVCEQKISANPKEVFATGSFKCCSKDTLEHILDLPMAADEI